MVLHVLNANIKRPLESGDCKKRCYGICTQTFYSKSQKLHNNGILSNSHKKHSYKS